MEERALRDEATGLLRALLRVDTTNPPGNETAAAVLLRDYLEANGVECELVARDPARANLVARIRGSGEGPSLTLLGHTDVVPAAAGDWRHPPFSGHLDGEGWVWGRGAVDMKNEVATRAVVLAALARAGFRPRGDLLLLAVADEEDGGAEVGMSWLAHARPDLATDYVLNEGAAERLQLADGRVVVTFNVGEKGAQAVRVTALGDGGPSTLPYDGAQAVPRLARLLARLDAHRPARRLLPATRELLQALVGDFEEDALDAAIARAVALHPAFADVVAPLFSTTIAPTRLHGSDALNVLPVRASVDCDVRTLPGDDAAAVRAELALALGDDVPHEVEPLDELVGGTSSPLETRLLEACRATLAAHDPGAILLPTLCNGFTDSHYARAAHGAVAYGFWPVRHTPYAVAAAGVHAADERIHMDDLGYATRFQLDVCRRLLG